MNIVITGGVGFLGTNCAIFFSKHKNNRISIVDDFSRLGVAKNANYLKKNHPEIKIIKSDINDIPKYRDVLRSADVVIHLAGQTAVTTSIKKPSIDFKSNLVGSFTLLEEIRKFNPRAIILYSSTNKVYGDLKNHNLRKNHRLKKYEELCHPDGISENEELNFISPYGCSKGATDLYLQDYARIYNLNTVVLRQSCIYGPFQIGVEDQGWVAFFAKQFMTGKALTIFGDGFQVRDLLYVDDLMRVYQSAIQNNKKVRGKAFNIGGGLDNAYSLFQVVRIIQNTTGKNIPIRFAKERLGDQKYFVSDNQKIKKFLGWSPSTKFHYGLKKLIDWQKNNLTI